MSKSEILHELFVQCQTIRFDESSSLIQSAKTEEEKNFIRLVTDFILQEKQKKVVAEKRF